MQDTISTIRVPECPLGCDGGATYLYRGLCDRLFDAPGTWDFVRCVTCGTVRVDPRIVDDEIGRLYRRYFTHIPSNRGASRQSPGRLILSRVFPAGMLSVVPWIRKERELFDGLLLSGLPPGRLLDIGCGNGTFLTAMRERGWSVEGVELDPVAAAFAKASGLSVHHGTLDNAPFSLDRFDAITMGHVIEHVPNVRGTLRRCWELLKPGGVLAILTPCVTSLGHRLFRSFWRELDPPRHFTLFSLTALTRIVALEGFHVTLARSTGRRAVHVFAGSMAIRFRGRNMSRAASMFAARALSVVEHLANSAGFEVGEELGLLAVKV